MYSIRMSSPLKHEFRQLYKPATLRVPEWLRRVWLWM